MTKTNWKVIFLALLLFTGTLWVSSSRSQSQNGGPGAIGANSNVTQIGGASVNTDPCASSGLVPNNVPVNITGGTGTTAQIVPLTAGKQIWVCEFTLTVGGSAVTPTTVLFEYGTGTNCATGPTAMTGAFGTLTATAGPAILVINGPYSGSTMQTAVGNELCIVTTGPAAGINLQGQVTYKIQ